jgi:hypothetical protein
MVNPALTANQFSKLGQKITFIEFVFQYFREPSYQKVVGRENTD